MEIVDGDSDDGDGGGHCSVSVPSPQLKFSTTIITLPRLLSSHKYEHSLLYNWERACMLHSDWLGTTHAVHPLSFDTV